MEAGLIAEAVSDPQVVYPFPGLADQRNVGPRGASVLVERLAEPLLKQTIFDPHSNLRSHQENNRRQNKPRVQKRRHR